MHDPEKFQAQTIKAIADLHNALGQNLSRQLALGAVVRSLLGQLPLAALVHAQEEYEAEVDHQAAQLPPEFQRPKFWEEWSELMEARRKELQKQLHQKSDAG